MNVLDQFRQAITAAGLEAPDVLLDDGVIHRFRPSGRRGGVSAWYVLHSDGVAAGVFGCWRAGLTATWCAKSDKAMTPAELAGHRQRIKAMKAQRDADEGCALMAATLYEARRLSAEDAWRKARLAVDANRPRAAKVAGISSLCLWIGVVVLGRVIGFVLK